MNKLVLASLFCLLCLAGCQKGEKLNAIEGTVTFDNAPLVSGNITFVSMETGERGQSAAPPTTIGVRDGKFSIPKKVGLKQGKYQVTISGFEGTPRGDLPLGLPIFPSYSTSFDYTGQESHDFTVPGTAKTIPKNADVIVESSSSKAN